MEDLTKTDTDVWEVNALSNRSNSAQWMFSYIELWTINSKEGGESIF